jgi:uncharacterized repeat protein (TIGR01451 family)
VTYTLAYSNVGSQGATGVVITDTLPAGMSFSPAANPGWTLSGSTLSYTVGSVAAGASGTVSLALVANATFPAGQATIANVASIADDGANGADPTPGNNADTETDTLDATPDLSVTKTDGVTSVVAGQSVTYTLAYTNSGTQGATGVVITDTRPTGMSFDPAANPGWTRSGRTLSYAVGNVAAGGSGSVNLVLRANPTFEAGQHSIVNVARVADDAANGADPTPANNTGTDTDVLDAAPDLALIKDNGVSSVTGNQRVVYTLRYANNGTQAATGVVITETRPTGMTFDPSLNPGWTRSGRSLSYTLGTVRAGATGSVPLVLVANSTFSAGQHSIVNVAGIADDGTNGVDRNPANNSGSDTDVLDATPDLSITKENGQSTIVTGQPVTYTLRYANAGTQGATGVVISDTLPQGLTFDPAANPGWTRSGDVVRYAVGSVVAGGSGSVSLVLRADSALPAGAARITNTASIADDGLNGVDPTPGNNSASDSDALPILVTATDIGCDSAPVVTVLDPATGAVRGRFTAYEDNFRGGARVALGDVDGDGAIEVVTAPGAGRVGEIRVFRQDGTELPQYRTLPFGPGYRDGIEIATGDWDNDGDDDLVAAASRGPGNVAVFRVDRAAADPVADSPVVAFTAFGGSYNGGASVATADFGSIRGGAFDRTAQDGRMEIVVGTGVGKVAQVRVFDVTAGATAVDSFQPLADLPGFRNGISVTAGRYDSDSMPDILIAGGRGAGSRVEVWSGYAGTAEQRILARYTAFSDLARSGAPVYAALGDLDGDGRTDRVFAAQGDGGDQIGVRSLTRAGAIASTFGTVPLNLRVAAATPRRPITR